MKKLIILMLFACPLFLKAQTQDTAAVYKGAEPIYMVDSVKISKEQLLGMNPNDISEITILKSRGAIAAYGEGANGGAVLVITKKFALKAYQEKFSKLSADYKSYLDAKNNDDASITYVIDGKKIETNSDKLSKLYTASGKTINGFIFSKSDDGNTATATITTK